MISKTFSDGFDSTMEKFYCGNSPISNVDYSYMIGLLKGGLLCGNLDQSDVDKIINSFKSNASEDSSIWIYLRLFREIVEKQ